MILTDKIGIDAAHTTDTTSVLNRRDSTIMAPMLRALPSHRRTLSDRPIRSSATKIQSYREDSDNDDTPLHTRRPRQTFGQNEVDQTSPVETLNRPLAAAKVTRSSSVRAKRTLFSQASRSASQDSPTKKRKLLLAPTISYVNIGPIPPWHTLPYHVLVDVFFQASPISAERPAADTSKEVKWLLGISRLCRRFFEPAITALYFAPPAHTPAKMQGLLHLLEQDPSTLAIDYRRKVKRLDISAGISPTRYEELLRLVSVTPQLKYLRIYDPTEYVQPRRKLPGSVVNDLISRLDATGCRLYSWEWNRRQLPLSIEPIHRRPSFENLRSLRLYSLDFEDFEDRDVSQDGPVEKTFSEHVTMALSCLENLDDLEFTNCEMVGCAFLLALPPRLQTISFNKCDGLTSGNLKRFLLSHGRHLRSLLLANNRELNLSFAAHLRESCPKLQVFKMDLNFSSPTLFAYDVEPHFDSLFADSETPEWPESLCVLHLERLRKLDGDTAKQLFSGLIDSAPRLTNLRSLVITAIVDVNWRERARLREVYGRELERVFLRKTPRPLDFKAHSPAPPETDHDPSPSPIRKSLRLAKKDVGQDEAVLQTDKAFSAASPKDSGSNSTQGLCHTVEIRMDNLRPADVLLTVDSFQDNEPSDDDGDWNGDDLDLDNGYAW